MATPEIGFVNDRERAGVSLIDFVHESTLSIKQQLSLVDFRLAAGLCNQVEADKIRTEIGQSVIENVKTIHEVCGDYKIDLTVTGTNGTTDILGILGFSPELGAYGAVVKTRGEPVQISLDGQIQLGYR